MPPRLRLRQLALVASGLTFLVIALVGLVAPPLVAAQYAWSFDAPGAWNQFRAVFLGFWLGLAALQLTAARRLDDVLLGDLCGVVIGLQASARLLSVALDGVPPLNFVGAMVLELAIAAAILLGRPR